MRYDYIILLSKYFQLFRKYLHVLLLRNLLWHHGPYPCVLYKHKSTFHVWIISDKIINFNYIWLDILDTNFLSFRFIKAENYGGYAEVVEEVQNSSLVYLNSLLNRLQLSMWSSCIMPIKKVFMTHIRIIALKLYQHFSGEHKF